MFTKKKHDKPEKSSRECRSSCHLNREHENHTEAAEIISSLTRSKNQHPKSVTTREQLPNLSRLRRRRCIDCQDCTVESARERTTGLVRDDTNLLQQCFFPRSDSFDL